MMQNEMIHTGRVLIVEGKYDAARLAHLTDAMILLTDGFGDKFQLFFLRIGLPELDRCSIVLFELIFHL